jgi:ubiquinone/menaquinone biosynthesis C-methylase UbiE
MTKDRGIENVERYFGNFTKLVADKIKKDGKVKILDAGCGYGVAMMGFVKRFGDKIDITGFNLKPKHGNEGIMKKEAIKKKIFSKEEVTKIKNMPKFIYCDASKKLPFSSESFDFIYSMASVYLYDDKIHFLEECNRILKKDGIARISVAFWPHFRNKKGFPSRYYEMWEIWDRGKEVKVWNYCKKIKGLKVVGKEKDSKQYLEIKKQKKLDFKLKLVAAIDYNQLNKNWYGVKSIYTTK